jgi:hypothetical protein
MFRVLITMGRFFQNLKQKTIAGSGGPTSAQLQTTGQTIFIEKSNKADLEELILVQKAHYFQTQNGAGLPHPGLSEVKLTVIDGVEDYLAILTPVGQEIYRVNALSIRNESGGTGTYSLALLDPNTNLSVVLVNGKSIGNNTTDLILNPLDSELPFLIDSSLLVAVYCDVDLTARMAVQKLSVK